MKKTNLLIICGGQSGEHDVSLSSASSIIKHLNQNKYELAVICIAKDGRWMETTESIKYLTDKTNLSDNNIQAHLKIDIGQMLIRKQSVPVDAVLPVMHGPYGEDGTLQGFLELCGVPFMGSDTLSSALAMDKAIAKQVFKSVNIATPKYRIINKKNIESYLPKLKCPCVIKPNNLGSSIGIEIVHKQKELKSAIKKALTADKHGQVLVEKFIKGRELTVPILDNCALPIIEIKPKSPDRWFDYQVKYDSNLVDEIVPAPIPDKITKKTRDLALRAHKALKCRHLSRVDMILQEKTNQLYVLEVNTLPGMTSASLFPKSARAAGMKFSELLDKLIKLAIES